MKMDFTVTLDGREPFTVTSRLADTIAYEETAAKHNWRPMTEAPMTATVFIAWRACRRTGKIPPGMTYEDFRDTLDDLDAEEDKEAQVPSDQAPGVDSLQS